MARVLLTYCLSALFLGGFSQAVDSSDYYYHRGMEDKIGRRFASAFNYFQKSVDFNKNNAEARKEMGLTAIEMRRYDVARDAFLKVLDIRKNDTVAIEKLDTLFFWAHQYKEAIFYANRMQQLRIGQKTNYIIGRSYYELDNYSESVKYLQAAINEEPSNAEIPYLAGRAYIAMENYKVAGPFMEQAISLDTSKPIWVYECAKTYAAVPNPRVAIKFYLEAAAKGYKTDDDFYENLGVSYIDAGDIDKGMELLKKILDKSPSDADLLFNIAEGYYKTGRWEEAISYYDKILFYNKRDARAMYSKGMAYQRKGETGKGQQLVQLAIQIDPSLARAKKLR